MGLVLSVNRSIFELYREPLWVIANDGLGATFSLAIPCRPEGLRTKKLRPDQTDTARSDLGAPLLDESRTKVELTPVAGWRIVFLRRDLIPALPVHVKAVPTSHGRR
jgi:hypothetical protein